MERFCKEQLLSDLIEKAQMIQKEHGFDSGNGWAQVKDSDIETIVEYGRFIAISGLIYDIQNGYVGKGL